MRLATTQISKLAITLVTTSNTYYFSLNVENFNLNGCGTGSGVNVYWLDANPTAAATGGTTGQEEVMAVSDSFKHIT